MTTSSLTHPSHTGLGAKTAITVARGDGIGPEIMEAVLFLLKESGAVLDLEEIEIGESVYSRGITSGIHRDAWDSLRRTKVFLKAPITTPLGTGNKSLNVTVRKTLGLYANLRPAKAYAPYIPTKHRDMDIIVVRENEEDTYGAIEHQQTSEVAQCLKLVTEPGSERVIRYAFETARSLGRRKVTCLTKNNIMKMTDGLFQKVFARVSGDYPDVDAEHKLIDIGTAEIATRPEDFDVVVTLNLYGDIISDVTALLSGSVGIAGSANIGDECAMFEAVHGSAPTIAGRGIANPSGLLHAGILMLHHVGQHEAAVTLHNAWLSTIEDGIHTLDMANERYTRTTVGTLEFAGAVAQRLGREPSHLAKAVVPRPVEHHRPQSEPASVSDVASRSHEGAEKQLVGVDVFLDWDEANRDPDALGAGLSAACPPSFRLTMITNRGTKVYPAGAPETLCTDHWRCRFMAGEETSTYARVVELLSAIHAAGYDVIKTENLYTVNGGASYSLGQGE